MTTIIALDQESAGSGTCRQDQYSILSIYGGLHGLLLQGSEFGDLPVLLQETMQGCIPAHVFEGAKGQSKVITYLK